MLCNVHNPNLNFHVDMDHFVENFVLKRCRVMFFINDEKEEVKVKYETVTFTKKYYSALLLGEKQSLSFMFGFSADLS